jgi:hypothetical protein
MTVGDKTWLKFTQDFTQVFEMQNLKVLQDSFKKSEILQILEMLHFKTFNVGISIYPTVKTKSQSFSKFQ